MSDDKRKKSDAQEARIADLLGGEVSRGSGSGWRKPQDVRSPGYLIECKGTDGKSISLKREWWDQLRANAAAEGVEPAIHLEIRGGGQPPRRLVVIEESDFVERACE